MVRREFGPMFEYEVIAPKSAAPVSAADVMESSVPPFPPSQWHGMEQHCSNLRASKLPVLQPPTQQRRLAMHVRTLAQASVHVDSVPSPGSISEATMGNPMSSYK